MKAKKTQTIAAVITLAIISACTGLIIYLSAFSHEADEQVATESQSSSVSLSETSQEQQSVQDESADKTKELTNVIEDALLNESERQAQVNTLVEALYGNDLLANQTKILSDISETNKKPEDLGYLFLPKNPAKMTQSTHAVQLDVPLMLQRDPQWGKVKYGSNGTQQLAENGCAIVTLAMVASYYDNKEVKPQDILKWSDERYYVENQGTSWEIFYDFALTHGYDFYNYGDDFYSAMDAVRQGKVVIASVTPGMFTEFGHILIIRGYDNGKVYVNDPNDDPTKLYSIQGIDEQVFLQEGANYWSLSKR